MYKIYLTKWVNAKIDLIKVFEVISIDDVILDEDKFADLLWNTIKTYMLNQDEKLENYISNDLLKDIKK